MLAKLILISLVAIILNSCSNKSEPCDLSSDMSIGPGTYAGRISEILVNPENDRNKVKKKRDRAATL